MTVTGTHHQQVGEVLWEVHSRDEMIGMAERAVIITFYCIENTAKRCKFSSKMTTQDEINKFQSVKFSSCSTFCAQIGILEPDT